MQQYPFADHSGRFGKDGQNMERSSSVRKSIFIGMMGAVSTVLMMLNFSVPFVPGFLKFDISELPALFAGAFLAHHRFIKQDLIDRIYEKLTNKQELIGKLAEMYNEPINALIDEPEENEGNVSWTASW